MRKTWTESDAQQLKALREQAGIPQASFAKRYALSVAQVRELEGGKTGSYYSEDIKAHTGRRLLAALGYVAPPPAEPEPAAAPAPTPPPASPSAPPAEAEAAPAPAPAAAPGPESEPEPEATPELAAPSEPQPAAVTEAAAPSAASESAPATPPAARRSAGPWLLVVAVAVIAVAVLLLTRTPGTVTVSTVTVPVNAAPAAAPADTSAPVPASDASAPASAASAASVVIAGADKPALPAGCEAPGPREATQYQSPVADKPATYVHVEAMQGARVCVLDSQNQVRALVLKVGESVNVTGVPPFTIRSAQWNDIKVFFQGLRVQVEPGAASDNIVILPKRGG